MTTILILFLKTILSVISLLHIIIIVDVIVGLLVYFDVIDLRIKTLNKLYWLLKNVTNPMYRFVRRFIPSFGSLDFSPVVIIFGLSVIRYLIGQIIIRI